MLTEAQAQLLLEPNHAALATLRSDGTVHLTPVWVDWDGERVLVNTALGRAKERQLRRDPRVSLLVVDRNDVARYVSITGRTELTTAGAEEHIDKMARKYLGFDRYPSELRTPGERRVLALITPLLVTQWNVDG